jgi:hypothetical protein
MADTSRKFKRKEKRSKKILKVGYRGVWRVLRYGREGDGEVAERGGIGPGSMTASRRSEAEQTGTSYGYLNLISKASLCVGHQF